MTFTGNARRAASRRFSLRNRSMDLFTAASQNWLRTPAGVLFIPVGRSFLFLWANADGTWDVAGAPPAGAWQRLKTSLPLGTAQAYAETFADEWSPVNTAVDARWRTQRPSPQMSAAARSMGLPVAEGMGQGEISDMIAVHNASRKFDDHVRRTA